MFKLNKDGYSLLEINLVIIIMVSLLFSIKVAVNSLEHRKEWIGLNELINDIAYYRDKSLINRREYEFRINKMQNYYSIINVYDGSRKMIVKKNLPSNLKFHNNNFNNIVVFKKTGYPSRGGLIKIKGKNKMYTLTIEVTTGNINLKEELIYE